MIIFIGLMLFNCSFKKDELKSNEKINYIPYYLKVYEADSLFLIKKHKNSYQILDSIFEKYKPLNQTTIFEYETYVKLSFLFDKKKSSMNAKFEKLISEFGYDKSYFKEDDVLNNLYIKLNDKLYDSLRKSYLSSINLSLRDSVFDMKTLDQKYRYNVDDNKNVFEKRKNVDSINAEKLRSIFNRNIYPNESVIGNYSVDYRFTPTILTILLHTNDSIRKEYFLPKLNKFVREGKCSPLVYGLLLDQISNYNNENQKYGTYNTNQIELEKYNSLNRNRKNIGLPSIEYVVWKNNQILKKYKIEY
ncbi:MAG TPA: hypothetical protein EYG89_05005 [Bacteroidia bacterium]|nr:hypothetical protein [Bacteroidia bacterium]